MKRALLISVVSLPFLLIRPSNSDAVVVECANCSDLVDQATQIAKQAQSYVTQVAQLQTDLGSYAQLVTSGLTLPQSIWSSVQGDIMEVRSLASAASLLTGNSGSILQRLSSAQGYANQAAFLPQNIGSQFAMWQQTLAGANLSLGRTLGVQQGQELNNTALQAAIQMHSQTAAGQMQAIQAGNELAALTNTQLQQVQTTLVAASQEQATRDEIAADRQALEDAQVQAFLSQPDYTLTGWPRY